MFRAVSLITLVFAGMSGYCAYQTYKTNQFINEVNKNREEMYKRFGFVLKEGSH